MGDKMDCWYLSKVSRGPQMNKRSCGRSSSYRSRTYYAWIPRLARQYSYDRRTKTPAAYAAKERCFIPVSMWRALNARCSMVKVG